MQYCHVCARHRGIEYELYNSYYLDFAPIRLCTLEERRLKGYQHHTQVTVQNINHPDDLKYVILVHLWLFLFWFLQRRLTPQLLLSYRGSRLLLCWKRTCHSNHLSHHHWSKMKHLPAPPISSFHVLHHICNIPIRSTGGWRGPTYVEGKLGRFHTGSRRLCDGLKSVWPHTVDRRGERHF